MRKSLVEFEEKCQTIIIGLNLLDIVGKGKVGKQSKSQDEQNVSD